MYTIKSVCRFRAKKRFFIVSRCLFSGVQQKVVGIIPSGTTGNQQTITTLQPNTTTVNITAKAQGTVTQQVHTKELKCTPSSHITPKNVARCCPQLHTENQQCRSGLYKVITTGGQVRTGMTVLRTPAQQGAALGKTIHRAPMVVQQGLISCRLQFLCLVVYLSFHLTVYLLFSLPGQAGKVVTQIIQGQPGSPAGNTQIRGTTPQTTASPRATQGPVKLTLAQLSQLSQGTQVRK